MIFEDGLVSRNQVNKIGNVGLQVLHGKRRVLKVSSRTMLIRCFSFPCL